MRPKVVEEALLLHDMGPGSVQPVAKPHVLGNEKYGIQALLVAAAAATVAPVTADAAAAAMSPTSEAAIGCSGLWIFKTAAPKAQAWQPALAEADIFQLGAASIACDVRPTKA